MSEPILKRFLSGMLATGIGSISVIVLGMLGLIISARLLSADALGAFFLLHVVVQFATASSDVGICMALERWLAGASDIEPRRQILNTALHFRSATIAVGAVILVLLMPSVLARLDLPATSTLITLLVAWFALEALLKLVLVHHQAQFEFHTIGAANVISGIVNFASILLFVMLLHQGLLGLLYAKLASRVLALAYAWYAKPLPIALTFDLRLLQRMLRYALPLYGNYFLSFLSTRADTLLIGGLLGTTSVAYYEVARRIPESLMQLYEAFRQVYFPFVVRGIARGNMEQVSALINHSTRFGAIGLGLACLVAFAFGEPILVALFSSTYLPSVLPFALLMVAASLLMIETTLGATLAALGESDKPLLINIVRTVLQLGAYLLLIPALDISGAALAALLAAAAVLPVNLYFLRRRAVAVQSFDYTKPLLIAGAIAIALWVVPAESPPITALILLTYIPALLLFSAIRITELQSVANWAKARWRRGRLGSEQTGLGEERSPAPIQIAAAGISPADSTDGARQ